MSGWWVRSPRYQNKSGLHTPWTLDLDIDFGTLPLKKGPSKSHSDICFRDNTTFCYTQSLLYLSNTRITSFSALHCIQRNTVVTYLSVDHIRQHWLTLSKFTLYSLFIMSYSVEADQLHPRAASAGYQKTLHDPKVYFSSPTKRRDFNRRDCRYVVLWRTNEQMPGDAKNKKV